MDAIDLLRPVFVMGVLSIVMFVWMLATRVPAMTKAGIDALRSAGYECAQEPSPGSRSGR